MRTQFHGSSSGQVVCENFHFLGIREDVFCVFQQFPSVSMKDEP